MSFGRLAESIAAALPPQTGARRGTAARWARPNHLAAVDAVSDFYGWDADALPPTRAEAMTVPAMARARHIIVTAARLPLTVDPPDYPAAALVEQPDRGRTRAAILTDTLDDLLFHGASLWRVTERYAADERPRHAERIALDRVTRDADGTWRIDDAPAPAADLLWIEGPHEGVLMFAGRALRSAVRLDRAYASTAANPAVAMELHQTTADEMSDEEISAVVADAQAAVAARGILYTNAALELRTHTADAENLLVTGRNAAAVDIARAVGLPAPILDAYPAGSSGTYQNAQARLREARDLGADMYSAAITARLSLDDVLPRGVSCAFDWDSMLRDDFNTRMDGYAAAQAAGVYSAAECREMETRRPNGER